MYGKRTTNKKIISYSISTVNPTRCSNFSNLFYFWDNTLHVSDGLSVHHQEFKSVHTATVICQTGTAVCLLARVLSQKYNKFEKLLHLVGFAIEIYYDARSYERQALTVFARRNISYSSELRVHAERLSFCLSLT
jgi:hypothetical protein